MRRKAAAFNGWHEPDESRGSSPESVSGSGCNSPGRLGLAVTFRGPTLPGIALIRTHVAQRTEGQEHPGERAQPGADRHTGFSANRQGDEADVRIPDPAGKDGPS